MDHLDGWRTESARVADLLVDADLGARVPACPDWDVADLAFHLGSVLDRFVRIAGQRLTERDDIRQLGRIERPADDADLPEWFRARAADLDPVLRDLDDDEPVWNFTRAPHVGAWVPRRMHHEMLVHRHDLEEAVDQISPVDPDVARDGVDELLTVLSTAGTRWAADEPATLQVVDDTTGGTWRLRLAPGERAVPVPDDDVVDVYLEGAPATLLLVLWRRRPLDAVTMTGDEGLATAMLAAVGR